MPLKRSHILIIPMIIRPTNVTHLLTYLLNYLHVAFYWRVAAWCSGERRWSHQRS